VKPRFARANWHLRFVSLFGVLQLDPEVILLAGVQLMLARLVGFCFRRCGYAKNCLQNATIVITGMSGNDSNLLIVFYVQIMPDDFVMQLHR
ncbi:hypothetical protein NQD77_26790, partial [Escherichia coli]